MAVELATERMMRAPSGSALVICRSRSSSGSELGIGTSITTHILAALYLGSATLVSPHQDAPMP